MNHSPYIKEVADIKTAVLMIHGILGTPRHFDFILPHIPADYSIYNILLSGHGKGVMDFAHSSMEKWTQQVSDLMNKLSIKYENIIIVAHSMGTLFAIDEAIKHSDKVRFIFLLNTPLKIRLRFQMVKNALKVTFTNIDESDIQAVATKNACSIKTSKNIFIYLLWIPRYMELFRKISYTRKKISLLSTQSFAFHSINDEMVSIKACDYLQKSKNIKLYILNDSSHYYYSKNNLDDIIEVLKNNF